MCCDFCKKLLTYEELCDIFNIEIKQNLNEQYKQFIILNKIVDIDMVNDKYIIV